jgi:cytochrome c biogenesis protein CcdA/thiol-disulfide isomerase/thioredoxin
MSGMTLYLVAFAGGLLAIVSPCILPVLPFVFARADQPFRRSGLPLLIGMALTFSAVGALATVTGEWIVRANQLGRVLALVVFGVFGAALLFPGFSEWLARPFVKIGAATQRRDGPPTMGGSLILGISTGLLWTPCAGPILGLVLAAAAVEGGSRGIGLLLAFAAGSVTALAVALLAGRRVFQMLKRSLRAEVWVRRALGVAVLAGVVGIALGWDTGVLARVSLAPGSGSTALEQRLVDRVRPQEPPPQMALAMTDGPAMRQGPAMVQGPAMMQQGGAMMSASAMTAQGRGATGAGEGAMPALDGAAQWLNGPPQTRDSLRGQVVLIDFWTYSCINCLRSIPYVQAWAAKYKDAGLVVIGVHSPEFAFERDAGNVAKAVKDLKITYSVAVDSNRKIWNAFRNQIWPAHYFIDAAGRIRAHHFGEGNYQESEKIVQTLLAERNSGTAASGFVEVAAAGAQAAPDLPDVRSPETYIGYERQEHYASPEELAKDNDERYSLPARPRLNQWGLAGWWTVRNEHAVLGTPPGKIVFRFHARDLHLVLGTRKGGKPVRFRVLLDGTPPLDDAGVDVDKQGSGVVNEHRLYQLIRQKGVVEDRTFQIEFLDPGVEAFAFTFG